ncbi:MAG: Na+/H+ antiporter subunit E [Acholeplasmataceae bacterium]
MKNLKRNGALVLFILLVIFWVIIGSNFGWIELIIGTLVSGMIVFYSYDMILTSDEATPMTFRTVKRLIILFLTLLKEVVIANFHVAKIVLSPKLKIEPGFKKIRQPLKKALNQAFYGNAITLTPGTLTVDMDNNEILVHGLFLKHIVDVEDSAIEKAFIKLEEADK